MTREVRLIERGASAAQTREIPVSREEFLIGRAPDCDLRLRVAAVSRHHCMIRLRPDEVTLIDLGSSNGTYLNGQRVLSQATLHTGDELRVENCIFVVDLGDKGKIDLGVTEVDPVAVPRRLSDMPKP
jgi:pSer/pThr/pTyr-binding forkhead associated (FHA) protein